MYSSEDLERFYFQYQTESFPSGESVQSFCKRNKVPYNISQKWYKDTRNKIVEGMFGWDFIGTFFKKIFNGCRNYVNMVPDKITLVTS